MITNRPHGHGLPALLQGVIVPPRTQPPTEDGGGPEPPLAMISLARPKLAHPRAAVTFATGRPIDVAGSSTRRPRAVADPHRDEGDGALCRKLASLLDPHRGNINVVARARPGPDATPPLDAPVRDRSGDVHHQLVLRRSVGTASFTHDSR